jgi:sugar phosphate isomerase/epimerase
MRVAVMAYSFLKLLQSGEWSTADVIAWLGEMGVSGVELLGKYVQPSDVSRIREALSQADVSVVAAGVVCDAEFRAGLRTMAALGGPIVQAVPGSHREGVPDRTARSHFIGALRSYLPEARQLGTTLTVENLGWLPELYGSVEAIEEICRGAGPELKLTYDMGNFFVAGADAGEALERFFPRVVHVHCKDWRPLSYDEPGLPRDFSAAGGIAYRSTALGAGVVKLAPLFGVLKQKGYQGWVSLEYEGDEDPRDVVSQGVAQLMQWIAGR